MKDNIAIGVKNVSKKYTLHHEKPTLVETIISKRAKEEFWALKKINLQIKKGESLGIIGPNGAGKTTLLEIMAGITTPTTGECITKGRLSSLISLTAGFQPDLTGEENILLNGLLLGMSKAEIKEKFQSIISFADLGDFIDSPLYTYSSGMTLRLGYSIVVHTNPDTLLVDEILSVGDEKFRKKSEKKMAEYLKEGKTLVLVSHNLDFVLDSCKMCCWLEKGRIVMAGKSRRVIKAYSKGYK